MPSTRALLMALTEAIEKNQIDVYTARQVVLASHHDTKREEQEEVRRQVAQYATVELAAQALGVSRSTLYRKMGVLRASAGMR